jgi:hypothetical protein
MDELTPEAKAEIAAAIEIVRQDKNDQWWKDKVSTWEPKAPPTDPPKPPDGPNPPPPTDPPKPPDPPEDAPKKRGLYWGDNAGE